MEKKSTDTVQKIQLNENETLAILMTVYKTNQSSRGYLTRSDNGILANRTDDIIFFNPQEKITATLDKNTKFETLLGYNGNNLREVFDRILYVEMVFYVQSFANIHSETVSFFVHLTILVVYGVEN
jgi:hypothetical protein